MIEILPIMGLGEIKAGDIPVDIVADRLAATDMLR
ncbi:hypothetical protein GGR44_002275 [Sphingobium fontiphilum]|uniref:Uncharacterized protein n=1 Tax=Sphingobium fontiphilum TaxID=944425 RepID=A0A7W6GR10_9SPHN|nr:hypothetical protein [Sphingobium fontiphilum]